MRQRFGRGSGGLCLLERGAIYTIKQLFPMICTVYPAENSKNAESETVPKI